MDNLGVAMNDTTLQSYALSKGITKSTQAMSNAEKVELAMQMFLEKTSKYAGNYAKENETFAGSLSTLKASIQNFMSGASDIEPVVDSFMNFANIVVKSIGEMAPKLVTGIVQLINSIVPQLPKLLKRLLPVIIKGSIDLINGLTKALPTLIPILLQGIIQIINGIVKILPTLSNALIDGALQIMLRLADMLPTMIPVIIKAILKIMELLNEHFDDFLKAGAQILWAICKGIISSIPLLLQNLPTIIKFIINFFAVSKFFNLGKNIVKGLWTGIKALKGNLGSNIIAFAKSVVNFFKHPLSGIKNIGINLVKGLWSGIKSVKDWLLGKIKGFGKSVLNITKEIFGVHSPSVEFAWIGEMDAIGFVDGIEKQKKNIDGTINDVFTLPKYTGLDYLENGVNNFGGMFTQNSVATFNNNQPINITVNADMDVDKFGNVFVKNIKTFSGGAKNSYNY